MTEPVKVRYGNPNDIYGMMDLAKLCTQENGLLKPSILKILGEIWSSLHHDHGLVGVIGAPDAPLEAAILLRIDTMPYSDENVLAERAIFVHPDFRSAKGGRASRLCEFAKQTSDALDLPLLIGVLSSERAAGKVRLYERHFGEPSGAYWLYHGTTGSPKQEAAE
jgi:hypothetical protein